jgi:hypothetical protein
MLRKSDPASGSLSLLASPSPHHLCHSGRPITWLGIQQPGCGYPRCSMGCWAFHQKFGHETALLTKRPIGFPRSASRAPFPRCRASSARKIERQDTIVNYSSIGKRSTRMHAWFRPERAEKAAGNSRTIQAFTEKKFQFSRRSVIFLHFSGTSATREKRVD